MSVFDSDYAEASREANDLYFGAPGTPDWDEPEPEDEDEGEES